MDAPCIWITGLPSSGKTTIARHLSTILEEEEIDHEVLDGDEVRRNLSRGAGFTKQDRCDHARRVAYVARLLTRHAIPTIVCLISPYDEARREAREIIGENFVLVYLDADANTCMNRDPKGLWAKAIAGEIKNFTGYSDPYEKPTWADMVISTERDTPEEAALCIYSKLMEYLEEVAPRIEA